MHILVYYNFIHKSRQEQEEHVILDLKTSILRCTSLLSMVGNAGFKAFSRRFKFTLAYSVRLTSPVFTFL
jgi:hypothetical protein